MKHYTLLYIAWAAMCLTSCLDEHPKDQLGEDAIYGSASEIYTNAVASLYNYIGSANESEGIQGTCRGIYDYNTLTTDEAIIPIRGGDWYDGGLWNAMYQHRWTADDQSLYDTWKFLYKVIVLANKSLDVINEKKDLLSVQQQQEYGAEVKAVRALFYYYAMDMFGRIFYGRITQPVANFLLAKLALNAEIYTYDDWTSGYQNRPRGKDIVLNVPVENHNADDAAERLADKPVVNGNYQLNAWETCIYYCDKLAEEGYMLEDDYAANFSTHNENSRENIFTIPMDKNVYVNQFHYLFRSYHYAHGGLFGWGSENGTCATVSTMRTNHYGEADEDARCKVNFVAGMVKVDGKNVLMDNGKALEYQPLEVKQNLTNSPYVKTAGARMAKYEVDRTAYMDGRLISNDIVLFRYADALLMKAEAKVRNGEDGSAELDAVRLRVGMPVCEASLENILRERLLELVWEGWRRQDLIRFGLFTGAYDLREPLPNEQSGYTTVFPIPQKCINLNKKLIQNKGYEK